MKEDNVQKLSEDFLGTINQHPKENPTPACEPATREQLNKLFIELVAVDYEFTDIELVEMQEWWVDLMGGDFSEEEIRESYRNSQTPTSRNSMVERKLLDIDISPWKNHTFPNGLNHLEALELFRLKPSSCLSEPGMSGTISDIINDWFREWQTFTEQVPSANTKRKVGKWEPKVIKHRGYDSRMKGLKYTVTPFMNDSCVNGDYREQ